MLRGVKCLGCKYYLIPSENDTFVPKCKAFPKRIPREIFNETVNHDKPYPNDNGIMFEPEENNN